MKSEGQAGKSGLSQRTQRKPDFKRFNSSTIQQLDGMIRPDRNSLEFIRVKLTLLPVWYTHISDKWTGKWYLSVLHFLRCQDESK